MGISQLQMLFGLWQHTTLSVDVIWSPWWNIHGATITIICRCHLIITAEYVRYQWRVGTSYELIGLACLLGWDELAFLLGWNHLDFEVQSIHWLYWFGSLLAADLFLACIFGNTIQSMLQPVSYGMYHLVN